MAYIVQTSYLCDWFSQVFRSVNASFEKSTLVSYFLTPC